MDRKVLTVSQVAEHLQMSKSTIYKYVESGKIPFFKIGNALRFLEREINDYIQKTIYDQRNQNENQWKF
jgi:excisionase family DNA binding protein